MKNRKKILKVIKLIIESEQEPDRTWISHRLSGWLAEKRHKPFMPTNRAADMAVRAMLDKIDPSTLSAFGTVKKGDTIRFRRIKPFDYEAEKENNCWDHMEDVKKYFESHEEDIAIGVNDFGDLRGSFFAVLGRPIHGITDEPVGE